MALQFTEREFIPVLLGGDINAYSVARAFYEEYQVKSLVFGKYQTGPVYRSQIIDYTPNVDIDTMPVMLKTVNGIAQAHADKTIVLVGCGDNYVALVAQAKDAHELADNIVAPYAPCLSSVRRRRSSTSCARSMACLIRIPLPSPWRC